jgi:hypothetical protein
MPGAQRARSLACENLKAHEQVHHRSRRFARHSPRNGLTVSFALSVIGLSCHRRPADSRLRSLTPASRRQDHTTSPFAFVRFVVGTIGIHRIPPHVRDDRETPLV